MNSEQFEWAMEESRQVQHYEERVPLQPKSINKEDGVATLWSRSDGEILRLPVSSLDIVPIPGDGVLLLAGEVARSSIKIRNGFNWGAIRQLRRVGDGAGKGEVLATLSPFLRVPLRCLAYWPGEEGEE